MHIGLRVGLLKRYLLKPCAAVTTAKTRGENSIGALIFVEDIGKCSEIRKIEHSRSVD